MPIEENLDDLEDSSGGGGNRDATKEHGVAFNRAWCSITTNSLLFSMNRSSRHVTCTTDKIQSMSICKNLESTD